MSGLEVALYVVAPMVLGWLLAEMRDRRGR